MSHPLKVCSFNLRVAAQVDGINYFPNRLNRIVSLIREEKPDLLGMQELRDSMKEALRDALPEYIMLGCGRTSNYRGESPVLAFRRDTIELVRLETYWHSDTPSVPASTFGGDQSSCPRNFHAALLKHKDFDQLFWFINTHFDHQGAQARYLSAIQIRQFIDEKNEPFVLTGDLNASPESPELLRLIAPTRRPICHASQGVGGTFHAFGQIPKENMVQIDYVITDMACDPTLSYAVQDEPIDGVYASDHFPVFAFVTPQ